MYLLCEWSPGDGDLPDSKGPVQDHEISAETKGRSHLGLADPGIV